MPDLGLLVIAGFVLVFLGILTLYILLKPSRNGFSQDGLNAQLQAEGDRTRRLIEEEVRAQRQELAASLREFRTEVMGKLDSELKQMGRDAETNRERLREAISTRLDQQSEAQANAARALREEVTTAVQKLQETLIGLASEQRAAQQNQFDNFSLRLKDTSDALATAMTALRTEIAATFEKLGAALTAQINQMGEHQKERLATVDQTMAQLTVKNQEAGEALRTLVEERLTTLQTSNATKLDEIRKTVDEQLQQTLQERLTASFKLVSDQLEQVYRGLGEMQKLADGVGDLKRVLANVKTRGVYGEVQLGALMEQMFAPAQYVVNAQVKKNSQERVEFALKLPGREGEPDVLLPIDSKFPIEDYERLQVAADAGDQAAVETVSLQLEARVRSFAKDIGDKYINPPQTTDIGILFLPTEGLYAEVIRRPGLAESLLEKHRVTIAGPTTLLAMLSAFRMALRAVAIHKRSAEVWNVLGAIKTEFANYGEVVVKLEKQLEASLNTVEKLSTRTRVMNRKLGDVQQVEMDPVSAQKLLGVYSETGESPASTETE